MECKSRFKRYCKPRSKVLLSKIKMPQTAQQGITSQIKVPHAAQRGVQTGEIIFQTRSNDFSKAYNDLTALTNLYILILFTSRRKLFMPKCKATIGRISAASCTGTMPSYFLGTKLSNIHMSKCFLAASSSRGVLMVHATAVFR